MPLIAYDTCGICWIGGLAVLLIAVLGGPLLGRWLKNK